MTQKYLYGAWFVITSLVLLVIFVIRGRRTSKWEFQLSEIFNLGLAIFGGISGGYLIFQTWLYYNQIQKLVNNEGVVAMTLGGLASIWFCMRTIRELAVKP